MKVLLISNYALDQQESMLRFANLLFTGLKNAGIDVRINRPEPTLGRVAGRTTSGLGKWLGYVDKFCIFPRRLRREVSLATRGDASRGCVVHICDHSNAMYTSAVTGVPVVITCHDLLAVRGALGEPTDCPPSRTGVYLQRWILRGLARASAIVCDSSATLHDVQRLVPGADRKLTRVVLVGMNYPYQRLRDGEVANRLKRVPQLSTIPREPYILHVGSNALRKNRAALMRIMAHLKERWSGRLVLAGEGLSTELHALARELNVLDRIIEVVGPDNQLLEALYNAAAILVYPSTHEGFGWPLIEAQACGCPVVCSDAGPFEEVVGNSAWRISVQDEESFAAAILNVLQPATRAEWVEKGLVNAKRFEPQRMIDDYRAVYAELLERHQSRI